MKSETINKIREIIDVNEKLKNSYFWSGGNANSRHYTEEKYSVPKLEWDDGKYDFTAEIKVRCSRMNVYVERIFTRNGKPTNITAIKSSLKRLESES